ncbi:MAG TPA: protein kinase [Gemmatimonadales bacterium]|nr:protein kinase [Gemmatimonadales bacterium]
MIADDASFFDALAPTYVVERQLGRGGMATVYLARELRHRRPVALKVLRESVGAELGPERFLREIDTAARLQHPHILPVFDSGSTAGRLWFTMPYVEGETLRQRLEREPALTIPEALRIAREAGQALAYAHSQGVVHRDVKPENILLTGDGSTLVADFGIARSSEGGSERLTTGGMVVGTPSYMSPEQASAEAEVDGRSDIYSLGCVLYEMLAGRPPFTGTTPHAIVARHLTEAPPPMSSGGRKVPAAVERVVRKAMAKSPGDRYAGATELLAALEALGAGDDRGPWVRPLPLALGGLALLAITVGVIALARRTGGAAEAGGSTGAIASGFNRRMVQLTTGEGVEEWPAWSPDGSRLAYVAEADGYRQIFVRTLATGEERRLTHETRDDIQPAWSPDGRRLAFVRASADSGQLAPSDLNGWYFEGGDIWTVDVASGAMNRLVMAAFGPAWSPDGSHLAFDAAWAGPRRVWISDTAGLNPRQLTSDSSEAVIHAGPRWSPDGRRLVFRRIEGTTSDLLTADVASAATVRFTQDAPAELDPAWSPDGRWIYYSSDRGGGMNVWRQQVDANGRAGVREQLTTGAGADVEPAPAPDGRRLAFAVRGLNSDVWQLPVSPTTGAATGPPEPVIVTTRVESRGSWSPDGRTIAFNSDRLGEMNIWLHDVASGSDRQLTTGAGGDYQPQWAPDGRTLVFFSARAGSLDVWSVSVEDGRLVRLTSDPAMDINPFYSPDGLSIAFLSDRLGRTDVWLMNADGTGQRRLTSTGAGGHFIRWSKDGRSLVYRADSILRVNVEDGSLAPMPEVQSGGHMSWSPDQSIIMDVRGHRTLFAYPVDGSPPRRVFEFPTPDARIDYPVWSPDGRHVLFDRAAPRGGDVWVMD